VGRRRDALAQLQGALAVERGRLDFGAAQVDADAIHRRHSSRSPDRALERLSREAEKRGAGGIFPEKVTNC
jgi:hypothetical protein